MIGFVGCGNMATAIIRGLIKSGGYQASEIAVYDVDTKKAGAFVKELSLVQLQSAVEITEKCSEVVLAVKPNVLAKVLHEIGDRLKVYDPLVISIAAGKSIDYIESYLPYVPRLVRIMPNINATCGASVTAYCSNERLEGRRGMPDRATAERFCRSFGMTLELQENQFSIFSAMAGCSPAFVYMFVDSLARAGVKYGLTRQQATDIARAVVHGSAMMMRDSDKHPMELVDAVCSPGGTTIEGVCALKEYGFETAVEKAIEASYNKDRALK